MWRQQLLPAHGLPWALPQRFSSPLDRSLARLRMHLCVTLPTPHVLLLPLPLLLPLLPLLLPLLLLLLLAQACG
jgi:hypothetical protein